MKRKSNKKQLFFYQMKNTEKGYFPV